MRFATYCCLVLALCFCLSPALHAQARPERVGQLENRVTTLEQKIAKLGSDQGPTLILFAAFCALWAQNTGRSGWLWFFLGLLFSFITILVLLWKNSQDIDRRRAAQRRPT